MRRNIPYIASCAVLIGLVTFLAFSLKSVEALEPIGTWKDIKDSYYIVFNGDSFVESTFNVERQFTKVDGGILMCDAAGDAYFVELNENAGGVAVVNLNGKTHTMRRATEAEAANPLLYRWGSEVTGKCLAAYILKQSLPIEYTLRLYEDSVFTSTIDDKETAGKYTVSANGDILLLTDGGTRVDSLHRWAEGAAFGEMTAKLQLIEQWASPVELLGYEIHGSIIDEDTETIYSFFDDTTCIRRQKTGEETEFFYFMSPDGLITLTDSAGCGIMDYIYMDVETVTPYRYVLDVDDWYAYLHGDTVPDMFNPGADEESPAIETVPLIPEEAQSQEPKDGKTTFREPSQEKKSEDPSDPKMPIGTYNPDGTLKNPETDDKGAASNEEEVESGVMPEASDAGTEQVTQQMLEEALQ